MEIKVSVVIPVYNAERYVASCIESLLDQSLKECEFIFVNDGSTDNSLKIIESYQSSDLRIKLVSQQNQGVSSARNTGLKIAAGEYLGFVDADDFIEADMYETLYKSAKQSDCDVVISNIASEMEGHKFVTNYSFPKNVRLERKAVKEEILPYFIKMDNLNSVCSKLFRKSIVINHKIQFPIEVALGEDGIFNVYFFSQSNSVLYIDYTGYHYREVEGSATRDVHNKDYFNKALEEYKEGLPEVYTSIMAESEVDKYKSIKLINNVMSFIYMYSVSFKNAHYGLKAKRIKKMINNEYVQKSLPIYMEEFYEKLSIYEKLFLNMIRMKLTAGLFCLVLYSRYRNR